MLCPSYGQNVDKKPSISVNMWVTLLFTLILSYLNLSACKTCSKKCYSNFCMDIALFCLTEFIVCGHSIITITKIQQLWNWDLVTIISERFFHDTKVKMSKNLNFRIFGHSIVLFYVDDMQNQKNLMIQTRENGRKPQIWANLGQFCPNLAQNFFFPKSGFVTF